MRVYEFAKLQGVSSKEVLAELESGGFEATNHMVVLEKKALSFLEKKFKIKASEKKEAVSSSKKTTTSSVKPNSTKVASVLKKETTSKATPSLKTKPVTVVAQKKPVKSVSVPQEKIEKEKSKKESVVAAYVQKKQGSSGIEDAQSAVVAEPQVNQIKQDVAPLPKARVENVTAPVKDKEANFQQASQEKVTVKQEMITPKAVQKNPNPTNFSKTPSRPPFASRPAGRQMPQKGSRLFVEQRPIPAAPVEVTEIVLSGDMSLQDAAGLMGKNPSELILSLLKQGIVSNKSNIIAIDTIVALANGFGIAVTREAKKVTESSKVVRVASENQTRRAPIVVVIGHVDHGKTTLLDFLRKSNVAAREKGGITQHIGAYEVDSPHGKVVFLDTPGHAAFSSMRARGVKMTDLAILVVAADDGIMPQTVEAINQAKAAGVPLIVAINKVDKVTSQAPIDTIKRQLSQHDLLVEDWGGSVICVPISGKTGQGIPELLEMITLQAEMMDLHADVAVPAKAFLLESRLDKGFGAIATVICLEGTLKQGDHFSCGDTTGKVRLILNSAGDRVTQTGPSTPVQIVGFDKLPLPADVLTVITAEQYNKAKSVRKSEAAAPAQIHRVTLNTEEQSSASKVKLIIKCDNFGSKEAIEGSIASMSKKNKDMAERLQLVSTGVGDITESDVDLAENTGARLIGFHVRAEKNAANYARDHDIEITLYQVIYHLTEALEVLVKQPKKAVISFSKSGEALVLKVFPLKDGTVIAGCQVTHGVFGRNGKAICLRRGTKVGESRIVSLQRDRKSVKEVHTGFECGFITEDFHEWQPNDVVHFMMETKEIPVD